MSKNAPEWERFNAGASGRRCRVVTKLFHATGTPRFWLNLRERNSATELLRVRRLQRAIGVIYRPETERWSLYFEVCLPARFDALIHFDKTRALQPLDITSEWDRGELPETHPEGYESFLTWFRAWKDSKAKG